MILGKQRWWWWLSLLTCVVIILAGAGSFYWIIGWTNPAGSCYFYLERGVLWGNNSRPVGLTPPVRPWYGGFEVFRSGVYSPWELLPAFLSRSGRWFLTLPMHFVLIVPLVFAYISDPPVRR